MCENGSKYTCILHGRFGSGLDLQLTDVKLEQICFSVEKSIGYGHSSKYPPSLV